MDVTREELAEQWVEEAAGFGLPSGVVFQLAMNLVTIRTIPTAHWVGVVITEDVNCIICAEELPNTWQFVADETTLHYLVRKRNMGTPPFWRNDREGVVAVPGHVPTDMNYLLCPLESCIILGVPRDTPNYEIFKKVLKAKHMIEVRRVATLEQEMMELKAKLYDYENPRKRKVVEPTATECTTLVAAPTAVQKFCGYEDCGVIIASTRNGVVTRIVKQKHKESRTQKRRPRRNKSRIISRTQQITHHITQQITCNITHATNHAPLRIISRTQRTNHH